VSRRRSGPRHTVTVEIAGERHVLRSDEPPEYTRSVAAHLDRTIRALGPAQPLEQHRTTILAALFITDELFRAREQLRRLTAEVEARAAQLAEALERAAEGVPSGTASTETVHPLPSSSEAPQD
jgi:cell division protein ZapA